MHKKKKAIPKGNIKAAKLESSMPNIREIMINESAITK